MNLIAVGLGIWVVMFFLILWRIGNSLQEIAAESHRIARFLEKIARYQEEMSQK